MAMSTVCLFGLLTSFKYLKHRRIRRTFLLKNFASNRGYGLPARTRRHHAVNLHRLSKWVVTRLQTNQNVRQVLLRVNSNEKCTGMKNIGLKMPEKDQAYVVVGFSHY